MKCRSCGAQIPELGKYCSYCGTEAGSFTEPDEKPSVQQIHVHHYYYEQEQPEQKSSYEQKPSYEQKHSYEQNVVYEPDVIYDSRPQQQTYQTKSPRSRLILFLLYFFAGYVGAHKFYSGKIGMGILYALTGGLFGIGLFFDFFSILLGNPTDSQGLPIMWR